MRPFFRDRERTILERQLQAGAAEVFFSRSIILVEGDSERLALPIFAKAIGIDLDALGITIVPVMGKTYGPLLKMLSHHALGVPWVVLSDGEDNAIRALTNALVEAGYVTDGAVEQARRQGRLPEDVLIPRDCFAFEAGQDFEETLILGGALPEFEAAIAEIIGASALENFIVQKGQAQPEYQARPRDGHVHDFLKDGRGKDYKPLLARMVAEAITQQGTDGSRIPALVVRALTRAREFAEGTATKA